MKDLQIDKNDKNPILSLFAHKQLKKLEKNNKEMAIQLSLESGVLCKYTSYIGVSSISYVNDDRDDRYGCTFMYRCEEMDHFLEGLERRNKRWLARRKIGSCVCEEQEPQRKPTLMSKVTNFFSYFRFWGNKKEEEPEPEPEPENNASRFQSEEQQQQPHHEDNLNFDPNHAWNDNAGASEIVKLQSRDGFWDISTKFMTKHFSTKLNRIYQTLEHILVMQ